MDTEYTCELIDLRGYVRVMQLTRDQLWLAILLGFRPASLESRANIETIL